MKTTATLALSLVMVAARGMPPPKVLETVMMSGTTPSSSAEKARQFFVYGWG